MRISQTETVSLQIVPVTWTSCKWWVSLPPPCSKPSGHDDSFKRFLFQECSMPPGRCRGLLKEFQPRWEAKMTIGDFVFLYVFLLFTHCWKDALQRSPLRSKVQTRAGAAEDLPRERTQLGPHRFWRGALTAASQHNLAVAFCYRRKWSERCSAWPTGHVTDMSYVLIMLYNFKFILLHWHCYIFCGQRVFVKK